MESESFAVIDFETTGYGVNNGGRVTEVAVVVLQNGQISNRFSSLVKTDAEISEYVSTMTGISGAMLKEAPLAKEVLQKVSLLTINSTLVAHNASFDRSFLSNELRLQRMDAYRGEFICTMLLARRTFPCLDSYTLSSLVKEFKISGGGHRALPDAEATAELFNLIVRQLRNAFPTRDINAEFLLSFQKGRNKLTVEESIPERQPPPRPITTLLEFDNQHKTIRKALLSAETEIVAAIAWFTDPFLFDPLCKMAKKGVSIRLIVKDDQINFYENGLPFEKLCEINKSSEFFAVAEVHHKFCVIDRKTLIHGSYNWTRKARTNEEAVTFRYNRPEHCQKFLDEFDRIVSSKAVAKTVATNSGAALDNDTVLTNGNTKERGMPPEHRRNSSSNKKLVRSDLSTDYANVVRTLLKKSGLISR